MNQRTNMKKFKKSKVTATNKLGVGLTFEEHPPSTELMKLLNQTPPHVIDIRGNRITKSKDGNDIMK